MPEFRRLGQLVDQRHRSFGGGNQQPGFSWIRSLTFEAGLLIHDPTAFDVTAGANLAINAAAAMRGNYGFSVGIPAVGNRFGRLDDIPAYAAFTQTYLFDINSLTMADGDLLEISNVNDGAVNLISVNLGYTLANGYFLRFDTRDDTSGAVIGTNVLVNDGAMKIDAEFMAASYAGADNGYMRAYIDGVLVDQAVDLDNDGRLVRQVRLGVIGVDAGTSGTLYYDDYRYTNQVR
jgi:hypothetical protein